MYFSLRLILAAVVLAFTVSCSNSHDFEKKDDLVVSLNFDAGCFDKIDSSVDLYLEERLNESKIREQFKCLTDAIDYIKIKVKGKQEGVYLIKEVKNVLDKFLFEDPKALSFYTSLLNVKSDIFGGSDAKITFQEMDSIKSFLKEAEVLAVLLKPFVKELTFDERFSSRDVALSSVRKISSFLGDWLNFQDKSINIDSALDFIEEAEIDIKAKNSWVSLFNLFRGVEAEKSVILNDEKDKLVVTFEEYYSSALSLYDKFESDWEYKREDFNGFYSDVDSFLSLLDKTVHEHPAKKWSEKDLMHFMNLVSEYEVLDQKISSSIQKHILDVLFKKIFPVGSGKLELSRDNFQKILLAWGEINTFILESKKVEGYKGKTFPFVKQGTDSFALFTQQRWPSLLNKDRILYIPDSDPEVEFTFQSLFHVSWQFLAAKLVVNAYADGLDVLKEKTGMTIEEVKEVYLDAFAVLKEVGFFDESSRDGWFRIFNEGNLFVPSANPDGFVSVNEVADYAAYMFSAYFTGEEISDTIEKRCPGFNENCSFNYIKNRPGEVFTSLPDLAKYFSPDLVEESYVLWQKSFEYIAKVTNDDSDYVRSHWFRGSVGNQYNEVIFRKYDTDKSDTLSFNEVFVGYNDFKAALKLLPQVRGGRYEDDDVTLQAVLQFFVKEGRPPKFRRGRIADKKFLTFRIACGGLDNSDSNEKCKYESDRSKIMALLAYLTSVSF